MWGRSQVLLVAYEVSGDSTRRLYLCHGIWSGLVLTGQWGGRKSMPGGGNSIGVAPRHGVLQECSVFQLGGGVGCLRRLGLDGGGIWRWEPLHCQYQQDVSRGQQRAVGTAQDAGVWWIAVLRERRTERQLCLVRNDSTISSPQST